MMEALTAFDAVAIVIVIVSTLMALARGFMRELATLGAFIAAIAAAFFARKFFVGTLDAMLPADSPAWMPDAIIFVMVFGYPPFYVDPNQYGNNERNAIYKKICHKGFTPKIMKTSVHGYGVSFCPFCESVWCQNVLQHPIT